MILVKCIKKFFSFVFGTDSQTIDQENSPDCTVVENFGHDESTLVEDTKNTLNESIENNKETLTENASMDVLCDINKSENHQNRETISNECVSDVPLSPASSSFSVKSPVTEMQSPRNKILCDDAVPSTSSQDLSENQIVNFDSKMEKDDMPECETMNESNNMKINEEITPKEQVTEVEEGKDVIMAPKPEPETAQVEKSVEESELKKDFESMEVENPLPATQNNLIPSTNIFSEGNFLIFF